MYCTYGTAEAVRLTKRDLIRGSLEQISCPCEPDNWESAVFHWEKGHGSWTPDYTPGDLLPELLEGVGEPNERLLEREFVGWLCVGRLS